MIYLSLGSLGSMDTADNAQRAADTGFGVRLPTYAFEDTTLLGAVERLLADEPLHRRLATISDRLHTEPGRVRGADLVERLLRTGEPVCR